MPGWVFIQFVYWWIFFWGVYFHGSYIQIHGKSKFVGWLFFYILISYTKPSIPLFPTLLLIFTSTHRHLVRKKSQILLSWVNRQDDIHFWVLRMICLGWPWIQNWLPWKLRHLLFPYFCSFIFTFGMILFQWRPHNYFHGEKGICKWTFWIIAWSPGFTWGNTAVSAWGEFLHTSVPLYYLLFFYEQHLSIVTFVHQLFLKFSPAMFCIKIFF